MSDDIKHECGIALIRLLKPLSYYQEKYGSALYGLKKLYLLMEKQHNRGQDGAGVAVIKLDAEPGTTYMFRKRMAGSGAVAEIFSAISKRITATGSKEQLKDTDFLKAQAPYVGELLLGHLRYGTHGGNSEDKCHPFIRENNWMSRNIVLAGNFNMTNVDELFGLLVDLGQHPREKADTVTMLEKIGHFLDEENQACFDKFKSEGHDNKDISALIAKELNIESILKRSMKEVDGGYTLAGMLGHGDAFAIRDPAGIRPCYYYHDEEIVIVTSERPAIQTGFDIPFTSVRELQPGNALIIRHSGQVSEVNIIPPTEKTPCSFERIYFSRGNDREIYKERKMLGHLLSGKVLETINYDMENTVFSYIPNTAATAFYGMIDGLHDYLTEYKAAEILKLGPNPDITKMKAILSIKPRREKIAVKDAKLRTFITEDTQREDMVAHVYDVTYGIIRNDKDTLVVIDDSIVRGTTLRTSILRILDRLYPKKIIIVSSAPQIRYPDCYGIDMSRLGDFAAFQGMLSLLKERGKEQILHETYRKCKAQEHLPKEEIKNYLQDLYALFTDDEISDAVSNIVKPEDCKAEVKVIYQSIANLHKACPEHKGDWYFSGNYPTPGGNRVVNRSFINFMEGKSARAY